MAVRKQQVGTAQTLKRTQRQSLKHAAATLASPISSPTKISAHPGKENEHSASKLEAGSLLVLPLHDGQVKTAQQPEQAAGMPCCFPLRELAIQFCQSTTVISVTSKRWYCLFVGAQGCAASFQMSSAGT